MTTKDIIYDLRSKNGLSQDDLAEKVFVSWEVSTGKSSINLANAVSRAFLKSI